MLLTKFVFLSWVSVVAGLDAEAEIVVGDVRVQALSATLLRIEPKGPRGFEDDATFNVIDRKSFEGIPISLLNNSGRTAWVQTKFWKLEVTQVANPPNGTTCDVSQDSTDVDAAVRTYLYPDGTHATSQGDCCAICQKDAEKEPGSPCRAYVYAPGESGTNCWPLAGYGTTTSTQGRVFGCVEPGCVSPINFLQLVDANDKVLWSHNGPPPSRGNLLQWPSPLAAEAYSLTDYPRFIVPPWTTSPIPSNASIDPDLRPTNGYDFRNNQNGDMYVSILGSTLTDWHNARMELYRLLGPTPLLPDYAYGTWFTWWHSYTEAEAKDDISHWTSGKLPLDIWGLDMNWRNTSNLQDRTYDHPNNLLFPDFNEWFNYLSQQGLKTYFNDHPFPQDMQTFTKEINFRWEGLTEWMARGLTFWWFDHNWGFSIPPPNLAPVGGWNVSYTDGVWDGLDNAAWGSHVYNSVVREYDAAHAPGTRPMTLTKFAKPDWRPGMPSDLHAESPAHHRYPVWWTGDGVSLQASTESMVDNGVHDFKPFVHSDCGGDYRGSAGDLLRWTAHCVFGTILRFHGDDHRPWTYDAHTEDVIRSYLSVRYTLLPSLIAAGAQATATGFPIVARADLFWPQYKEATSNQQYLHLNDTLVAPIFNSATNITSRSVWIPPGKWQDAWDGSQITGPQTVTVTKPYEQQPMWHRVGGLIITTSNPGLRVEEQDWTVLTLEAFPDVSTNLETHRTLVEDDDRTFITMSTSQASGSVSVRVSPSKFAHGWILRLHLLPGQKASSATANGKSESFTVHEPRNSPDYFPFLSSAPPAQAGHVVELNLPLSQFGTDVTVFVA